VNRAESLNAQKKADLAGGGQVCYLKLGRKGETDQPIFYSNSIRKSSRK